MLEMQSRGRELMQIIEDIVVVGSFVGVIVKGVVRIVYVE